MRIFGIAPGLQRTGSGSNPPLARFHAGYADMSLHRIPCA